MRRFVVPIVVFAMAAAAAATMAGAGRSSVRCQITVPSSWVKKFTAGRHISVAEPFLDIVLSDHTSRSCDWHFTGGTFTISQTHWTSRTGALANLGTYCRHIKSIGLGLRGCTQDSIFTNGPYKRERGVVAVLGSNVVIISSESNAPVAPMSLHLRAARYVAGLE